MSLEPKPTESTGAGKCMATLRDKERDGVDYGTSGRFRFGESIVIPMKYIFKLLLEQAIDEKCVDFPDLIPPMI